MASTKRLGLPLIDQGQAMKHVTHNEALAKLDGIVQLSALAMANAAPPAPVEDAVYLVGPAPTGVFAGHQKAVAVFQNGGFTFAEPRVGWRCYVQSTKRLMVFDGADWVEIGGRQERMPRLGINMPADDTNRLSVNSKSIVLTATSLADGGTADLRVKLNKDLATNTGSILFQSSFSGRAELGLMGDDHFRVKVSAQGSEWKEALLIDSTSAAVQCPAGLTSSRLYLSQSHDTPGLGLDGPLALRFQRSRGAATGIRSPIQAQDTLGAIVGCNWDGSRFLPAASISFESEIGSMAGIAASRISFSTSMPGLSAPKERIRIEPFGTFRPTLDNTVGIGSASFRWTDIFSINGVSTVSDEKEKVDIETLPTGLEFIRMLRPVSFRWKVAERLVESDDVISERAGRRKHLGLVAQEVKTALDGLSLDCGLYTYDSSIDRHSLRYDQFLAPVIKAIQELDARIEDLSRRLTLIGN